MDITTVRPKVSYFPVVTEPLLPLAPSPLRHPHAGGHLLRWWLPATGSAGTMGKPTDKKDLLPKWSAAYRYGNMGVAHLRAVCGPAPARGPPPVQGWPARPLEPHAPRDARAGLADGRLRLHKPHGYVSC